ncbi:ribokinase [Actinotalea sp. Marseille-Q4924]|uniref:ribokinase n=1 Tax=Actinotalea sp. Marseille-Q4924 TaxID=2866571 RepID=UPI001CE421B6|nr:ribokinase [Actinotalea sp. Marseille-Q4924]
MSSGRTEIAVVGSVNVDLVATVARLPLPGQTVPALGFEQFSGGKGANQAVAAARLGRRVALVGLTGSDAEGAAVRAALARGGVDVTHLGVADGAPTGRAIVLVADDAENSIVVVAGSNALLGEVDVAAASEELRDAAVVLAQLEVPVDAVLAAARGAAGTFVLNPAPARELPDELLDLVDVLVLNEVEYEVVIGRPLPADLADLPAHLAQSGLRCAVVVTLGGRGAALCQDGAVVVETPPHVPVVDTTGAGDTFIGALADALSRHEGPPAALRWAVHAASLSVGALGATTGMPTSDQVGASLARSSTDDGVPR